MKLRLKIAEPRSYILFESSRNRWCCFVDSWSEGWHGRFVIGGMDLFIGNSVLGMSDFIYVPDDYYRRP